MFLFKRNGYYYIEYLDQTTQKLKRISTKCSKKINATDFMNNFKVDIKVSNATKIITLKEFSLIYKEHIKNGYSAKYYSSVQSSFNKLIKYLPNKNLSELTIRELEQFILDTYKSKNYAALLYFKTLKAAFSKACIWGYLSQNPFKKFKSPRSPKKFPLFISFSEFELIISLEDYTQLRNLYTLDFNTGLRLGEIINLEWRDVDHDLNFLKVANTQNFMTKSREERIIPLNENAKRIFREQKLFISKKNDYVFTNKTGLRFELNYVSKKFKKCVKAANVNSKIHFHSIRHSFASNLAQKGVSLYIIKSLLGHASISTTEIYSHLNNETLRRAVYELQ